MGSQRKSRKISKLIILRTCTNENGRLAPRRRIDKSGRYIVHHDPVFPEFTVFLFRVSSTKSIGTENSRRRKEEEKEEETVSW